MKKILAFASDNYAGAHEKIIESLIKVNSGYEKAYGEDEVTLSLSKKVKEVFGSNAEVFPLFNGTAANVISLSLILKSYEACLCTSDAHIHNDECGAPEKFVGSKLLTIETPNGKLTPEFLEENLKGKDDQHHVQIKAISLSQSTEMGTIYTIEELKAISKFAKTNNFYFHMDGSRLAYAANALKCSLKEITSEVGVDILSFGGTKCGLIGADAIIIFNKDLNKAAKYLRKQGMQLASKMRFISAQLLTLIENDFWNELTENANSKAKILASKIDSLNINNLKVYNKVEANAVMVKMPKEIREKVLEKFHFYIWDESKNLVRLMTSFKTSNEEIDAIIDEIKKNL